MTDETDKSKKEGKAIAGKGPDWWLKEIGRSRKEWNSYRDKARAVLSRYRDEREQANKGKRFNILFSNTETLRPVIYSQPPVPDIRRRWQDKDPVGRLAATVLQRATTFCLESYDFNAVLNACNKDYLLPGFAVARVKLKPYFKKTPKKGEDGKELVEKGRPVYDEALVYQEATTEYVAWDRFVMSRSKVYERVWWVAFADDLTKSEVAETFGEKTAEDLKYSRKETSDKDEKDEGEPTVRVWELWCKRDKMRGFVAEGHDGWVREPEADPLRLQGFFPNAKPLWSVSTNDTLKPVPEYTQYEDQARELDDLTERIDVLTSALRRRGVYDAEFSSLFSMLAGSGDNNFVGMQNWASFVAKGGLEKMAMEMPLDGIVKAIIALEDRRERVKQIVYEVTGIADIVRGSSNPNETLGAQQLKGKWAGLRISSRQKDFADFARDLVRMKAEMIAERFDPQTLSVMTGVQLPMQAEKLQAQQAMEQFAQMQKQHAAMAQQAQQAGQQPPPPPQPPLTPEQQKFYAKPSWEDVLGVLRNDKLRGFKIDIETDSTVQPDADAEKAARSELLAAVGGFSRQVAPAIQMGVIKKKTAIELIQFAINAFKVGSRLEEDLDESANQPEGPTPEMQQQIQQLQAKEQELMQREAKVKDAEHGAELARKDAERAGDKVDADKALFRLEQQYAAKFEELSRTYEERFNAFGQKVIGTAEESTRQLVEELMGARGGADEQPQPEGVQ